MVLIGPRPHTFEVDDIPIEGSVELIVEAVEEVTIWACNLTLAVGECIVLFECNILPVSSSMMVPNLQHTSCRHTSLQCYAQARRAL